jgi:hypothetical protein
MNSLFQSLGCRVDVLISDFEKLIFRFEVPVGEPGS